MFICFHERTSEGLLLCFGLTIFLFVFLHVICFHDLRYKQKIVALFLLFCGGFTVCASGAVHIVFYYGLYY